MDCCMATAWRLATRHAAAADRQTIASHSIHPTIFQGQDEHLKDRLASRGHGHRGGGLAY